MNTTSKIIIEIAHATLKFGTSSLVIDQICNDKEVEPEKILILSSIEVPITKIKAADSPIILPIDNNVADNIPGKDDGNIILNIVWVLEAPKAKEEDI